MPDTVALLTTGSNVRLIFPWAEGLMFGNDFEITFRLPGKGSVWNDDYGQLDGSIFVHINDHLQVGLEGNNLANTSLCEPGYRTGPRDTRRGPCA